MASTNLKTKQNMEISKKYVIFKTKPIVNNSDYLALEEVSFDDWTTNAFDTEEDAIAKIVEKEWTYEDFYILKQVYITTKTKHNGKERTKIFI